MKNANTSQRLKQIMSERNLRQADILQAAKPYCERYGIKLAKNDLSQYVNGKVEPGQEKLTILGLALNVNEAWLMGYDVQRERDSKEEQPTGASELHFENATSLQRMIINAVLKMPEERQKALAEVLGLSE